MIHKTAIVDSKAKVASSTNIGPYCVIGPNVELPANPTWPAIIQLSPILTLWAI